MLMVTMVYIKCEVQLTLSSFRLTAQLLNPQTKQHLDDGVPNEDLDLVIGPGRGQYASLSWPDLTAIAPWVELSAKINGQGLGH